MPRRFAVLPLVLLAVISCSPEPRWIAVAGGGDLALFDGRLRSASVRHLHRPVSALESSGDGLGMLVAFPAGGRNGTVAWVRPSDGATLVQGEASGSIGGLWLDREGRRVFALSGAPEGRLDVLTADRLTRTRTIPVCPEPVSLAFAPDQDRAYVTCRPGAVVEVDLGLHMVVRRAMLGADSGRACGAGRGDLSANGTLLLVPCAVSGHLIYLDRATLKGWDSMPVGVGAAAVAVTPHAVAVILVPDSNRVLLVNLRDQRVVASVTARRPADVALSADGRIALVAADGEVIAVATSTGEVMGRAQGPGGSSLVRVWPGRREPRLHWTGSPRSTPPL